MRLTPAELNRRRFHSGTSAYNRDYDNDYPPVARTFKDAIASAEAVLFVTPEYNRSILGALKNAIDWASRPYGKNSFARKPDWQIGRRKLCPRLCPNACLPSTNTVTYGQTRRETSRGSSR